MIWVYIRSEPFLWTVGFYSPDGQWHTDSDHAEREHAAKRAAWLNGSPQPFDLTSALVRFEQRTRDLA